MIEAYRIGISLLMDSNINTEIGRLIQAFEQLQQAVGNVNREVKEIAAGLSGLSRIGKAAAEAWTQAALAMERAAKAAAEASATGIPSPGEAAAFGAGVVGGTAAAGRRGGALVPFGPSGVPLPPGANPYAGRGMVPYGYEWTKTPGEDAPFNEPGSEQIPIYPNGRPRTGRGGGVGTGEALMLGWGAYTFAKDMFEATAAPQHYAAMLEQSGFSPEQAEKALKQAHELQQKVFGSSLLGNIETTSSLMAVTQNPEEALKLNTPELAKLAVVLGQHGQGDQLKELVAATRAAEFRGTFTEFNPATGKNEFSTSKFDKFLHQTMAVDVMTEGQIGPREILQFMRSGGGASAMLSDPSLFSKSLALMMAMGPANAGTALQGFSMQFSAGKMSEAAVSMLQEMGVLNQFDTKKDTEFGRKLGVGQFQLNPEAWTDPKSLDKIRMNPAAFVMENLIPSLTAYVEKHYASQLNAPGVTPEKRHEMQQQDIMATGLALSSRMPGGKFISEIFRNYPMIERDVSQFNKLMGVDEKGNKIGEERDFFKTATEKDPTVAMQAFHAAWTAFLAALGDTVMKPAIDMLNAMTSTLNKLSDWAKAHPDGTKAALEGLAVGIAALGATVVVGALMSLTTGPGSLVGLALAITTVANALGLFNPKSFPHDMFDPGHLPTRKELGYPEGPEHPKSKGVLHDLFMPWDWNPDEAKPKPEDSTKSPIKKQSYYTPEDSAIPRVINVTLEIDRYRLGSVMFDELGRRMGGPVRGTTGVDPRVIPENPGAWA